MSGQAVVATDRNGSSSKLESMAPDTRARIGEAVLEIFSDREFHRVGLIEVARAANVSLQTIYKYYGSKENLLFRAMADQLRSLSDRLFEQLHDDAPLQQRLRKCFCLSIEYFEHHPQVLQLMLSSAYVRHWRQHGKREHRDLFLAIKALLAEGQEQGVLTEAVDDKQLLDILSGVIIRTMQSWIMRGMNGSPAQQSQDLFDRMWLAIAREA